MKPSHEPFYAVRGEMITREAALVDEALAILERHGVNVRMALAPGDDRVAPPYEVNATIERVHVCKAFGRVQVDVKARIDAHNAPTVSITPPDGNTLDLGRVDMEPTPCRLRVIPQPRRAGLTVAALYKIVSIGETK